jgi:hypothetical protein
MKVLRLLGILCTLAITACGDGSIKSPDFSPKLLSITVTPNPAAAALGDTVQFTATGTCTTPPGSANASQPCGVSDVSWNSSSPSVATINGAGLATTLTTGSTGITATKDGVTSPTVTLTVGPPEVRSLVVTPGATTIPLGASQSYKVQGVYSDHQTRDIANPASITWASSNTTVATVAPTTGSTTVASSGGAGKTTGTTTISATDGTLTGSSVLTVSNAVLDGVVSVSPATDTVSVGLSKPFQLIGHYADGTTKPIPNSDIDWTVSDLTVAAPTADPNDNKVLVKGLKVGSVTITGKLKPAVNPAITQRSATATLTVVDAACTTPLVAPKATTATAVDALCLACSVDNPGNAIDANPINFAGLTSTIGLLTGGVTLTVNSNAAVPFPAGGKAGFIVGRPAGQLLSAEVLSTLTLSTLLNGAVQDSVSLAAPNAQVPPLLRLTLLGMLGESNTALLSITTTKPYDAIRLNFSSMVAGLLTTTQVFSACGTATPPPP